MALIGKKEQFKEQKSYSITVDNKRLLLIHHQQKYYLIADQCGHFGAPLYDARIENTEIFCSQHGISFSLETGDIVNRPYENCDPISVYKLEHRDDALYCFDL